MKIKSIIFLSALFFALIYSCSNAMDKNKEQSQSNSSTEKITDTIDESCNNETIKDPNNPKPMALMMREMAKNAQLIKELIAKGEQVDSLKFPFIRFYLVEPTDPSVLEPQFYENARLFQEAYKALFKHPKEQTKYYNLVIGKCVNCHQSYCSGPLKRIRKLIITP